MKRKKWMMLIYATGKGNAPTNVRKAVLFAKHAAWNNRAGSMSKKERLKVVMQLAEGICERPENDI